MLISHNCDILAPMDKGNDEGKIILRRALWLNAYNIALYYPRLSYVARHRTRYSDKYKLKFVKRLIRKILVASRTKVVVHGEENIPDKDGMYICCNHQQKFDPLAVWDCFPRALRVIVDEAVTDRPLIYEIIELTKSCKISRTSNRDGFTSFKHITADLKNGANYLVFPEGEYNSDVFHLKPFKNGCFKAPLRAEVPILPVVITDSHKVLMGKFFSRYKIHVYFLEPLMPEEFKDLRTHEISEIVRTRIQEGLDQYQH